MKKVILICAFLMLVFSSYSQWKLIEPVNNFGDKIGTCIASFATVDGTFSNSATSGSGLSAIVQIGKEDNEYSLTIRLFEYNDTKNNIRKGDYLVGVDARTIKNDGKSRMLPFYAPGGSANLHYNKNSKYKDIIKDTPESFINFITKDNEFIISVTEDSKIGVKTTYQFKIDRLDSEMLNKLK